MGINIIIVYSFFSRNAERDSTYPIDEFMSSPNAVPVIVTHRDTINALPIVSLEFQRYWYAYKDISLGKNEYPNRWIDASDVSEIIITKINGMTHANANTIKTNAKAAFVGPEMRLNF
jgi:hypothetical protein